MARSALTRVQLRKAGNLTIDGYGELMDNLDSVINRMTAQELKGVFFKAGSVLRDQAKANAPVKTGKLKAAIFCAPGKSDKSDVLVGVSRSRRATGSPAAPHGHLVEFGTVRAAPRPFFRPAIAQTKGRMADIITTGLKSALEKAIK